MLKRLVVFVIVILIVHREPACIVMPYPCFTEPCVIGRPICNVEVEYPKPPKPPNLQPLLDQFYTLDLLG